MKFLLLFPLWAFLMTTQFFGVHTVPAHPVAQVASVQKTASTTPIKTKTTSKVSAPVVKKSVTPKPAATSTSVVNSFATQVEQHIFEKINIERVNNGLLALIHDNTLATVARAHSKDMFVSDYFEHTNLSGCSSSCRVTNAGYKWSAVGENIYMMSGYKLSAEATAEKMVQGWMNSPGHRANILNTSFTHVGTGVYVEGSTVEATQDFAKPR